MAAAHIAINYNTRGHCQTITTACTSSTQAIGEAYRLIKYDTADVVITGGSDSMVNPNGMIAFSMLGVISKNNAEFESEEASKGSQRAKSKTLSYQTISYKSFASIYL